MPRPRSQHAQTAPGCRPATPGARQVQLRQRKGERPLDALEALESMPSTHWAYAFATVLRYRGVASNYHCYELLPEDEARVRAHAARIR